jgi:hypothetical protein
VASLAWLNDLALVANEALDDAANPAVADKCPIRAIHTPLAASNSGHMEDRRLPPDGTEKGAPLPQHLRRAGVASSDLRVAAWDKAFARLGG